MKKTVLFLCINLIAFGAYSQKESGLESKKAATISQQQKNELKKVGKEAERKRTEEMVLSRQFILEVSSMSDQSMNLLNKPELFNLSSSLNYFAVNLNKIVLQLETNTYQTSNWPFGNFPVHGTYSKYEVQKLVKTSGGYVLKFLATGEIGAYYITFNVLANGKTDLRMQANNGVTLLLRGVLVPLNKSRIKPLFI